MVVSLKTLAVVKKRTKYHYLMALAIAAVFASCVGAVVSIRAQGVISLSTRLDASGPVDELPVVEQQDPFYMISDMPEQNIDQELVTLLQSTAGQMPEKPQWKIVRMRVTGYCTCPRCCGRFSDGYTANMHKVHHGDVFVAADKRVPFGTDMIIPGYNQDRPVEVKDRGRLIKGNRLDVFFNNHKVAKKWGMRYLDVMVKVEK